MNRSLRILALTAALFLPAIADAQTPPTTGGHDGDDAAARLLYEHGAEAYQAGDYAVALQRFQQAYDLSHRPQLLYNIGTTLDRLRRDREALDAFQRFLAQVPEHPRRAEVESRARVLGETIAQEDAEHAAAEERARQEREASEAARRAAEEEAERSRLAQEAAERRAAEASDGLPPAVMLSVGGAAVAAGVVGIVFGVRTNQLNDDYVNAADAARTDADGPYADPETYARIASAHDRAHRAQTAANVSIIGAGVLAVGAITLIFFTDWDGDGDEAPPATMPIVGASATGGFAGIQHRF